MKIIREYIKESTLEDFADEYGLDMYVTERDDPSEDRVRFFASFRVEVVDGCTLVSAFGNGATEEEAINNYKGEISQKTLRIGNKNVKCPRFV